MQSSLALYRAKMQLYNSKLNIPKELIKISQREILSINSDNFKNVTTRSISQFQSSQNEEDRLESINILIENDLADGIRMKSEAVNSHQTFTEIEPKRHHSFSSYLNQRNDSKKHQKELKVFKSLSKNIREMKVEKCKTSVVFHKNQRINNTQQLKKPKRTFSQSKKPQKFPDFKGNLIIIGMKQKKLAQLKAEEQKLRRQSLNLPYVISGWNSKSSPPKKFNTVTMENVNKNSRSNLLPETSHQTDDDLIQFLKLSKINLKKRKNLILKKLSKSLIN